MDLFDNLPSARKESEIYFNPAEAFAAITLACVTADGYIASEETEAVMTSLSRMELFRSYSDDVLTRLFDKLGGIVKRQGKDALLKTAIISLPHHLHDTAFAIAADLILADGEVAEEEEKLLHELYNYFELPTEIAKNIIDVMVIKNKG